MMCSLKFHGLAGLAAVSVMAAPLAAAPASAPAPVVAAPPPAPAAPAKAGPRIFLSPDGTVVYIIGALMDDSFLRFDALLQGAPKVRTVFLAPHRRTDLIAAAARLGFANPNA